jgi:hypothetical protein
MKAKSHIFSNMRGSVGGITYSTNQYDQIIGRARTIPVQPNTNPQQEMKAAFAYYAAQWRNETALNRSNWERYANTVNFSGPLGTYQVGGRQLYCGNLAANLVAVERSGIAHGFGTSAPAGDGFVNLEKVALTHLSSAGTGFAVAITPPDGYADCFCAIQISSPLSQTINYYKGPFNPSLWRATEIPTYATQLVEVDGLQEDARYFVRVHLLSPGEQAYSSTPIILSTVATTVV